MVTALVARWQLGGELYRETGDTDLGVPPVVVREEGLIGGLLERGYMDAEAFVEGEVAEAAHVIRALFDRRDGAGMSALEGEQRLSQTAADERFTRIRALVQRLLPLR